MRECPSIEDLESDAPDGAALAHLEAIEIMPVAVALVDTRMRVLFANRAARLLLARRDGLGVRDDCLYGADAHATSTLRRCLGGAVCLPRPSGKPPLLVTVVPLRLRGAVPVERRPAAALFIADPEAEPPSATSVLGELFGLTPAEERVALLVAEGRGLPHVARLLDISHNTARTHLARALEKTGTSHQAELARLVQDLRWQRPCGEGW